MRIHLRLHNSEPLTKLSERSELEQTLTCKLDARQHTFCQSTRSLNSIQPI
jgi:hypothetical protein